MEALAKPLTIAAFAALVLVLFVVTVTMAYGGKGPCEGCWKQLEREANGGPVDLPDPMARPAG